MFRTLFAGALLLIGFHAQGAVSTPGSTPLPCRIDESLSTVAELPELSGIAVSRAAPDRVWAHNDSGAPVVFALDRRGAVTGRVSVPGAAVEDWEAIAVGPCASGACLYLGDIGDNDAKRKHITVHRVAEPGAANGSADVSETLHAMYPDGPQDAEALLATRDGDLYIVTKGSTGPVALYRFPRARRSGNPLTLERVGKPRDAGKAEEDMRITDGSVSRDGEWVVLRTHRALIFYRSAEFVTGNWREERIVSLQDVGEPQGEGVALGDDGIIYLAGEGGGKSRPGTFARMVCGR